MTIALENLRLYVNLFVSLRDVKQLAVAQNFVLSITDYILVCVVTLSAFRYFLRSRLNFKGRNTYRHFPVCIVTTVLQLLQVYVLHHEIRTVICGLDRSYRLDEWLLVATRESDIP